MIPAISIGVDGLNVNPYTYPISTGFISSRRYTGPVRTVSAFGPGEQSGEGQDLRLTPTGDLEVVDGLESVRQRVIECLQTWAGQWYLDRETGVAYRPEIFARPTSVGLAGAIVSDKIRSVDGVTGVSGVVVEIDPVVRRMTYKATGDTPFGRFTVGGDLG